MAQWTLAQIKSAVASYVAAAKQADANWSPAAESFTGLIEKIMKTVIIDGNFNDKLPELDAQEIPFGQAIEEYYVNLTTPFAYNNMSLDYSGGTDDGLAAKTELRPYRPNFDDVCYSERLGRMVFPTTIDDENYKVAFNSADAYSNLVTITVKRLYDSIAMWKYGQKKQLLGNIIEKATGKAYTTNSTKLVKGEIFTQAGVAYKALVNDTSAVNKDLADRVSDGDCVVVKSLVVTNVSKPVDTASGEAFIKAIKDACEDASFVSEGNALNGTATIGAEEGLVLYIKKGIMSSLEVDTLAGAFHAENLAVPCRIKVVEDFGTITDTNAYAILIDPRGIKLYSNINKVKEKDNASADYRNLFAHTENTGYISKYTFVRVYSAA